MFTRRKFLYLTSHTIVSVIVPASLSACGGAVVPISGTAKTVAKWFTSFAGEVGAGTLSTLLSDWISQQILSDSPFGQNVQVAEKTMEDLDFIHKEDRKPHLVDNTICYEVGHSDLFNGCCAFLLKDASHVVLAEGPTIVALGLAAEEMKHRFNYNSNDLAGSLIPIQKIQYPGANNYSFNQSYDKRFGARTRYGTIHTNYQRLHSTSGKVSFQVDNGMGTPFGLSIEVAYRSG